MVAKLEGHTGAVNTVAWSPHSSGLLASCSIDGTARVSYVNLFKNMCSVAPSPSNTKKKIY